MRARYNRVLSQRARSNALRLREEEKMGLLEPVHPPVPEPDSANGEINSALTILREATISTPFEDNLWIVGGYVRDKILGLHELTNDVDLVMQSNALELANLLHERGISQIAPVVYPRFGTALVRISGCDVELVTARKESYANGSRKPSEVEPATLEEDAFRRDFTINTLLENLHTGEVRDPLGLAYADLEAKILRTPGDPGATFADDPLRMLRAVRFASKLDFDIAPQTWDALVQNARRLEPPTVSWERIRDEFSKTLLAPVPSQGLEMLRRSQLLDQIAPELCEMVGVTQNEFHSLPVWDHTLLALDNLVSKDPNANLILRLGTLLHDIGKPATKSTGDDGRIHFYQHQDVGAEIARKLLLRLKFSTEEISSVTQLVAQHMRIGEYNPKRWTDAAVRRLVRETGDQLPGLFELHRADVSALSGEHQDMSRSKSLQERIDLLEQMHSSNSIESPLSGNEIMVALGISAGPDVGRWKDWLINEVLEGRLAPDDKGLAAKMLREANV